MKYAKNNRTFTDANARTVLEVALLQKHDLKVTPRYRGAPIVLKYASAELLATRVEDVGQRDYEILLNRFRETHPANCTGFRLISDLNTLLHWAVEKGLRTTSFRSFPNNKHSSTPCELLSREALDRVVAHVNRHWLENTGIRLVLLSLACLGLGVLDARRFSISRVDESRWEYVLSDGRGRLRLIPIPDPMRGAVSEALQQFRAGQFPWVEGTEWLSISHLTKIVREIGHWCDIPGLTPNRISRSFTDGDWV